MDKNLLEFPISIYGEAERVNDVLTKARCRVFYTLANRNGTYITPEFAEELISTLHYVPVKGIYNGEDYTDHGIARDEGRIYGIVPETNNFAWEPHLDEDGVERTYACTDVYIFSALYQEANSIIGKSLSMELYEPSLQYHMAIIGGSKYAVFDHGSFLGLQVLGDDVEPCFEGASFFSLQQSVEDAIRKIKEYSNIGGKSEMPKINFKLSDSQKHDYIWTLLNTEYDEEHNWAVTYGICEIFEDYALVCNYETGNFERVFYKKSDENDSVELGDRVVVYIVDVTEKEKDTLDTLRHLNGDTYELVKDELTNAEKNANDCVEYSAKIEENNNTIATLNMEAEAAQAKIVEVQAQYDSAMEQVSSLSAEVETLNTYKKNVENQLKETVVSEYVDKLPDETIESYRSKFDEYTTEELDMHLAYELKKTNSAVFTQAPTGGVLPKDAGRTSVEEILSHYKR